MHEKDGKKFWLAVGLAPTVLQMAAALFAPTDVVDRLPLIGDVVESLAGYVPSLHGYISLSAHAQVAALFFVLGWLLLPMQVVVWLFVMWRYSDARFRLRVGRSGLLKLWVQAFVVAVCIFAALFWIPQEWSIAESWGMNRSRIGLAFFGAFGFLMIGACVGFVLSGIAQFIFGERNG